MSVYEASFVRVHPDRATSFRETCRLLREANARWLAASPTNFTLEHTVRTTEGSNWTSISGAVADQMLETISRALGTAAVAIGATDEMVLEFSYIHFDEGKPVRVLQYALDVEEPRRGRWTSVQGEPQPWESILFSARLVELYRKHAPDEAHEGAAEGRIKLGFSIPWACSGDTVAEIARALQLPWEPTAWPITDRFPPATRIEVVPGSPERWPKQWRALLRQKRRPWWRF